MATEPEAAEPEPTPLARARAAIVAPVEKQGAVIALAICAGLASLAPDPAGLIAPALLVFVAFGYGKR